MTKPKSYFIATFGCQINEAESEQIAAWYESRGWKKAKKWPVADEVVVNSCSVRESAENRVFGLVNNIRKIKNHPSSTARPRQAEGEAGESKRGRENSKIKTKDQNLKFAKPKIILTGCMVGSAVGERKRFSLRQLKKRLPQVDEFRPWWQWGFAKIKAFETRKEKKKALVPIMKGCSRFCTYCVVPYSKGKEISYPFEEIICQVEELVIKGWQHIVLLGQNVNSYGNDFSKQEKKKILSCFHVSIRGNINIFALLLERIHKIPGIKKISFMTSNPWDFSDEIIKAISLPKIDRQLHLPVQSGDNGILKKMNRPYTAQEYLGLVKKIKKEIPAMKISTDIIVGFPGETKAAFENTVKLCKKIGFNKAYVARYSPRPGTAAFKLQDDIPPQEKKRRWRVLNKLINT